MNTIEACTVDGRTEENDADVEVLAEDVREPAGPKQRERRKQRKPAQRDQRASASVALLAMTISRGNRAP